MNTPAPSPAPRGVYMLGNDRVVDYLEALFISLRQHSPDLPARLIPYNAQLTRTSEGAKLAVDVTDWDATLELTVGPGLTMSDADLVRFAAGVHILNRSDPE